MRALREDRRAPTDLPLRAGVNRGHVFTGDIGGATRRTYAVMGDAVNLAARLTARAQRGRDPRDRGRARPRADGLRDRDRAAARQGQGTGRDGAPGRRTRSGRDRRARGRHDADRRSRAPSSRAFAPRVDARAHAAARRWSSSWASRGSASPGSCRSCARWRSGSSSSTLAGEHYATSSRTTAFRTLLRQLAGVHGPHARGGGRAARTVGARA